MEYINKAFIVQHEGREINGVISMPQGDGLFPLVVMNHGFGGSKEEGIGFISISEALAEAGIAAVRFDFSGCGASVVPFKEFSLAHNESDSNAVLEYVLRTEPIDKNRLGILGYSMGGRLALMISAKENSPYKAMSLIAPGGQDQMDFQMVPGFAMVDGEPIMDFYGTRFHLNPEFLRECIETNQVMKDLKKEVETIIFSGSEDILVCPEVCKDIANKIDATLFTLEGADHGYGFFENPNMEYVNKIVSETVKLFTTAL